MMSGTPSEKGLKVNLGCGLVAHDGWVNVDGSLNAWLANHPFVATALSPLVGRGWKKWPKGIVRANLEKKLPFEDASVSLLYTSHFVEHLTKAEAKSVVDEIFRILKPSAVVRIVVPDLEGAARSYVASLDANDDSAADTFLKRLYICRTTRPSPFRMRDWFSIWNDYQTHFWMYDARSMARLLREAGFINTGVKPCQVSSEIEDIVHVERKGSVGENGAGFAVEATRP